MKRIIPITLLTILMSVLCVSAENSITCTHKIEGINSGTRTFVLESENGRKTITKNVNSTFEIPVETDNFKVYEEPLNSEGLTQDASVYDVSVVNGVVIIKKDGAKVDKIEFKDSYVEPENPSLVIKISKNALGGNEIEGAEMKLEGEGFSEEWVSETHPKEFTLNPGKYTLTEVVAPEGYNKITTAVIFRVDESGNITLITTKVDGGRVSVNGNHIVLEDSPIKEEPKNSVKISKTDLGGNEIKGAKMRLTGDGVDETWTSDGSAKEFSLKSGKYILKETVAPDGYQRVTTEIEFEVSSDGSVKLLTTQVNGGGKISANGNHITLSDAPVKIITKTAEKIKESIKTGDATQVLVWVIIGLLAGTAIFFIAKKKIR